MEPTDPAGVATAVDASEAYATELLTDPVLFRDLMQLQHDCERVPEVTPELATWVFKEEALCVCGRARLPRRSELRFKAVAEISVRGSKNIDNWITNFTAQLVPSQIGACRGRVHRGFQVAHAKLKDTVLAKIFESVKACIPSIEAENKGVLVLLTGYSLGGALATLLAYTIALHGCETRCVTWGSPRVGDIEFRDAYRLAVPRTVRFVNGSDPVPRVPINHEDPYDDGLIIDNRLSNLLQKAHAAVNAKDYCHVCKGTALGQQKSSLHRALASINVAFEQGVVAGFSELLSASHVFPAYVSNIEKAMSGGPSQEDHDRIARETAAEAAQAAVAAVGAAAWLFKGIKRRWSNR